MTNNHQRSKTYPSTDIIQKTFRVIFLASDDLFQSDGTSISHA
jgi:hypothetical protein